MSDTPNDNRLGPILVDGPLTALLGSSALATHLPALLTASLLLIASVVIAVRAPSKAKAWRRLLLLSALFSFATAWTVWSAIVSGAPEVIQSHRSENALGLAFLLLIGAVVLLGIGPAFFVLLGLILATLAWIFGREPEETGPELST
jgi:hypothetical protein